MMELCIRYFKTTIIKKFQQAIKNSLKTNEKTTLTKKSV